MRNLNQDGGLMLIVDTRGEQSEVPEAESAEETIKTTSLHVETTSSTTTTEIPTTTTVETSTSLPTTEASENTTEKKKDVDMTVDFKNLPAMLNILKQLSIIPAVVKSFAGSSSFSPQPTPLFASSSDVRYSPVESRLRSRALDENNGYNAQAPSFVQAPAMESETPVSLIGRRDQIPNMPAPIIPVNNHPRQHPVEQRMSRLNIYGIDSFPTTEAKAYEAPTTQTYFEELETSSSGSRRLRPRFDISNLTIAEVEQLESIHRKLFRTGENGDKLLIRPVTSTPPETTEAPLYVFDKPRTKEPPVKSHNHLPEVTSSLSPSELNELMMIKDLPDLEDLTKGMDLSLLSKPGGFSQLKQQFIERIVNRSIQLRRYAHRMN
ncbi:unnamed protein product [Bursaphelenchus xylophilus]|nr:unnamed protein product [Bursaphelenchus xylophilus]CAG9108548.1 unnamed protein product [Bursaphelenchus xylophilus]